MKSFRIRLKQFIREQHGITLIEALTACTLFFILLLPLSSMYIKGIGLYANTQTQTLLRNEADFLLGTIMDKVANSSSFELANDSDETDSTRLFTHPAIQAMIQPEDVRNLQNSLVTYNRYISYNSTSGRTESSIPRVIYQFHQLSPEQRTNPNLYQRFSYSSSYLVSGRFALHDDNKRLVIYLVIAPRGNETFRQDGRTAAFATWDDVMDELTTQEAGKLPDTIHMIRTEFAVNNVGKGQGHD